jgi:hypothetical protein
MWRRYDVMVCTLRLGLVSLLRKGALTLASLAYLVLDEADKLLELRVPRAVRRGARRMRWRDGAALPLHGDDAARGRGPGALGAAWPRWL